MLLYFFLHVNSNKDMTFKQKVKRIDYIGNGIIIGSSVAILYALTYTGSRYAWSEWHTLVPLIIGLVGFIIFMIFEASKFPVEPVMPIRLFANRTSAIVYINTFLNSALLYWVMYFLPVYFQAVLASSPARTGVQMLPIVLVAVPGAIIAVIILSKFGKYKLLHLCGFAIMTISMGLFCTLNATSPDGAWIGYQVLAALGSGMILNTLLPAFQAGLTEADQAAATASWAFMRSFGNIWGVAIPASIFNNQFEHLSWRISDPSVRAQLSRGQAYEHAHRDFITAFQGTLRSEIVGVYSDSLRLVWAVAIAFSGLAFFLAFAEKDIKLRTELETEFGLVEDEKESKSEAEAEMSADKEKETPKKIT